MDFLPYAKQVISQADMKSVAKALASGMITRGPEVKRFEEEIAKYCGAKFAVAFPNGTEALAAACYAAEVSPFDRIVTSPNTFIATATCGLRHGATVSLVDIEQDSGNVAMDALLEKAEKPFSRGKYVLIPVHYAGVACDMHKLNAQIKNPSTVVIEDGCAALGGSYPTGEKIGSCAFSQMCTFSFHPAKSITTGEGGMVTTNQMHFYERLLLYRNNGVVRDQEKLQKSSPGPWYYEVQDVCVNNNFTDFQAALGTSQLKRLPKMLEKRKKLVYAYQKHLEGVEHLEFVSKGEVERSAHNLFVITLDFEALGIDRKNLMERLKEKNIGTQVHYLPVHLHPVYKDRYGDVSHALPHANAFYNKALTLPLFYDLTESQVEYVANSLKSILHGKGKK